MADGDARKCLNALEIGVLTTPPGADGVIHFTARDRGGEHPEKGGGL